MGRFAASIYSRGTAGSASANRSERNKKQWPERMAPELFATGRLTMRTAYPAPYTREVVIRRPAFFANKGEMVLGDSIRTHFPGLQPRSAHQGKWESNVYGLGPGRYLSSLFNLEGVLLRQEMIEGDMLAAGLLLCLQDLTDVAWFPTSTMFAPGIRSPMCPNQTTATKDKRFLVIPCLVGSIHWVVAIADQQSDTLYWFNSLTGSSDESIRSELAKWLGEQKLMDRKAIVHETVKCEQQCSVWECGLLLLENVRSFFREPSLADRLGPRNWGQSRMMRHPLPGVGRLDNTKKKTTWVTMTWIGWIRAELGADLFSDLRAPTDPVVGWEEYHGVPDGAAVPNGLLESKDHSPAAVERYIKKEIRSEVRQGGASHQPTRIKTATQIGASFDTWVSGELGLFFWEFLPTTGEWEYKPYRTAPASPPERYAIPIKIPTFGYAASDDEDEEVADGSGGETDYDFQDSDLPDFGDEIESSPYALPDLAPLKAPVTPSKKQKEAGTPIKTPQPTRKGKGVQKGDDSDGDSNATTTPQKKTKGTSAKRAVKGPSTADQVMTDVSTVPSAPRALTVTLLPTKKGKGIQKDGDSDGASNKTATPKENKKGPSTKPTIGTPSARDQTMTDVSAIASSPHTSIKDPQPGDKRKTNQRGSTGKTDQTSPAPKKAKREGTPTLSAKSIGDKVEAVSRRIKLEKQRIAKRVASADANTDSRSKAWSDAYERRGRMLGRALYDHTHSPTRHLSPSRSVDWRGWPVEKALDNKGRPDEDSV